MVTKRLVLLTLRAVVWRGVVCCVDCGLMNLSVSGTSVTSTQAGKRYLSSLHVYIVFLWFSVVYVITSALYICLPVSDLRLLSGGCGPFPSPLPPCPFFPSPSLSRLFLICSSLHPFVLILSVSFPSPNSARVSGGGHCELPQRVQVENSDTAWSHRVTLIIKGRKIATCCLKR